MAFVALLLLPRRPQVLGTKVQLVRVIDVPRRVTCVRVQVVDGVLMERRGLGAVQDVVQARRVGEAEYAISEGEATVSCLNTRRLACVEMR